MTVFSPVRAGRAVLTVGCLLGACATRTVPDRWSAGAAASAEAPTPRPSSVTRTLEAEPGTELTPNDAGRAPVGQTGAHHHHGGHRAH